MGILEYFDRLAIVHLPARLDRYRGLRRELSRIGIDIDSSKVCIPDPPMPDTPNGFASRGVYGSYLSHLEIIENAHKDGLEHVWVLEDDAIFSRRFDKQQTAIAQTLRTNTWDMFFVGHSGWKDLSPSPTGLLRYSGPFIWAHSYAVHRRIMPRLITYLRETIEREQGHPEGGKLYIDAAYFFFRQFNPDVTCVITSPCLSVQKGSPSSLGARKRYEKYPGMGHVLNLARGVRDEGWRQGLLPIHGPQNVLSDEFQMRSTLQQVWPQQSQ
jgi:GR25 family glycosyltransferase involved in LPS biosynthesis